MLYRFKSKNMGDVVMLEANGRRVLEIIGKDPSPTGIILPEQMPAAIKALEAAIALEGSGDVGHANHNDKNNDNDSDNDNDNDNDKDAASEGVGLHQRAKPFMDMLRWNINAGQEVVWGV